jgi:hypothetical protein
LHFWLLDILSSADPKTLNEIVEIIDGKYLSMFENAIPIDISTLRKKLKEYVGLELIAAQKAGKQLAYRLAGNSIDLDSWRCAVEYFSETNPVGVVGSFLLDKFALPAEIFLFKHNYLLFAPDCGIVLDMLTAINERRGAALEIFSRRHKKNVKTTVLPLKIFISTQGGRQYVASCDTRSKRILLLRIDSIQKVKLLEPVPDFAAYSALLTDFQVHLWGASSGNTNNTEHFEMTVIIEPDERYIVTRLEREKRCGQVEKISDTLYKFSADVYDAQEMFPWIRTYIGRIQSLTCSNKAVEDKFKADLNEMALLYGGDGDAVQ